MTKTNNTIENYHYFEKWYIDIVEQEENYAAYLYHSLYQIKLPIINAAKHTFESKDEFIKHVEQMMEYSPIIFDYQERLNKLGN